MDLTQILAALPHCPGVYLMKGRLGEVIYIGKAKSLAARGRSYFHASADTAPKTRAMVGQVTDIEYLVVASDLEALVLEGNLIKKHRPRYNVVLRDDKNYPFLRIPMTDDYPRPEIVRRVQRDGARYFGPYIPSGGLHEMLRLLHRIFPIPTCTIPLDGTADRPCIEYEMKRCLAPCTGYQSRADYQAMMGQVILFLEGRNKTLLGGLREAMTAHAEATRFEAAAAVRDQIAKIDRAMERQRITSTRMDDLDVIGIARQDGALDVQCLFVRGGMWIGRKDFLFENVANTADETAAFLAAFLRQFYEKETLIPPVILTPATPADAGTLTAWLSERRGRRVRLVTPQRGRGARLIELACDNARAALVNRRVQSPDVDATLAALQTLLALRNVPNRIEGYDISNTQGTAAVGSMVVFEAGVAKKADYRHFRIRTVQGPDDFQSMAEVLDRRMTALRETGGTRPDLILIDGGIGQISAVCDVLRQHDIGDIDVIGLAKERDANRPERVYLPGRSEPILLPEGSAERHLLMRIRDEAHRFAITHHRKVRSRQMLTSMLEEIPGIGKKRRLALLKHFGTLAGVRAATVEALAAAPSMNPPAAQVLHAILHS